MISKKTETESCIICAAEKCDGCCLSAKLGNHFNPNQQTKSMIKDGYLTPEDIIKIHRATMEERLYAAQKRQK